jgi:hypothetical protein
MVRRRTEDGCRMIDGAGPDNRGTNQDNRREEAWQREEARQRDETRHREEAWRREEGWSNAPDPPPEEQTDLHKLAQDWITLWQSELSAMASDRELQETWRATMALWAGVATAVLSATTPHTRHSASSRDERGRQRPGAKHAAGAKATAAPPDSRDAEIERLARHIATLEARLEELERGGHRRPLGTRPPGTHPPGKRKR